MGNVLALNGAFSSNEKTRIW